MTSKKNIVALLAGMTLIGIIAFITISYSSFLWLTYRPTGWENEISYPRSWTVTVEDNGDLFLFRPGDSFGLVKFRKTSVDILDQSSVSNILDEMVLETPQFWGLLPLQDTLSDIEVIDHDACLVHTRNFTASFDVPIFRKSHVYTIECEDDFYMVWVLAKTRDIDSALRVAEFNMVPLR